MGIFKCTKSILSMKDSAPYKISYIFGTILHPNIIFLQTALTRICSISRFFSKSATDQDGSVQTF